ncbi:MAG: TIGR02587 family membrane protein [Acidobacteria bacterium]|nr:TIGR02587 family membrane protein [Acidobacteriota bacterium]
MRPVSESLQEYARGAAGGLLLSLPLLYTMEVWWAGFIAHPWRLAVYVLATFVLLLGYNEFAGLRRDNSFAEVVIDSVEEMGIGIVVAALVLWLLGRVTLATPATEAVGQIAVEAMTVAIGVSVGTAQFGAVDDEDTGAGGGASSVGADGGEAGGVRHFGGQVAVSLCGAVLFAANVAPTEEIVQIAVEVSAWRLLGLALLSLALAALILYYSEFAGARKHVRFDRRHDVLVGTVVTYAVALSASALILWFFGRFDGCSLAVAAGQVIVLGVAATLGSSAGRLLLQ